MTLARPSEADQRRAAANRRLGWTLALVALALFMVTLLLRS
jgi:hypothetical protein